MASVCAFKLPILKKAITKFKRVFFKKTVAQGRRMSLLFWSSPSGSSPRAESAVPAHSGRCPPFASLEALLPRCMGQRLADPSIRVSSVRWVSARDRVVNDKWERRSISDIGSHRAKYRSNIGGCPDAKYWHILAENLIYRQFRVIFHNKN
eukprot:SAG25_NODE_48_length_18937_cov_1106.642637_5_plen_151_part_00